MKLQGKLDGGARATLKGICFVNRFSVVWVTMKGMNNSSLVCPVNGNLSEK